MNEKQWIIELAEKLDSGRTIEVSINALADVLDRSNFVHFDVLYNNENGNYLVKVL